MTSMTNRCAALGLVSAFGAGCSSQPAAQQPSEVPASVTVASCDSATARDAYVLGQVSLVGDVLAVPVSFGGGCATHSFSACWDGSVLDSFPPMVLLAVRHDAHDDRCDAWITRKLQVSIAPILDAVAAPLSLTVIGAQSQLAGTTGAVRVGD